uniref:CUE domain-containing protein 3 n=1 Tax=Talaromyces marneffei PM1 TaxID=1077442 RepID=A0A093Y613_TALMA
MDLPRLIPVPPTVVRKTIPNEQWEATLDAWILLTELRLHLSAQQFGECAHADRFNASFLTSYFAARDDARLHGTNASTTTTKKSKHLRRSAFLLTRRYYLDVQPFPLADELLDWRFLGDFCDTYHSSSALKQLLSEVWTRYENVISPSIETGKLEVMEMLLKAKKTGQVTAASDLVLDIRRLSILASALPQVGCLLMTGSDYLDTLHDAYRISLSASNEADGNALRSTLVANVYVGLTSLLKVPNPNLSLLLDQLFSLKASASTEVTSSKKSKLSPDLLSDLRYLVSAPQKRGQDLVSSLREYQQQTKGMHNQHYQRLKKKKDKGKAKANTEHNGRLHVHKLSLITQIRDLFPDLGEGYIVRLLDYYTDNVETVVAHLLESSLPPELEALDKTEPLPVHNLQSHDVMEPRHTLPQLASPRPGFARNIDLEDDEIIQAAQSAVGGQNKKLLFGRANIDSTADTILADRSQHAANKAAILSALANFDSDDDERDDTYDAADVGGTVDSGIGTGTVDVEPEQEKRNRAGAGATRDGDNDLMDPDMTLYRLWKSNTAQFARDSTTRRSQSRTNLKRETGMTDEAIEGWAVMLQRDMKKQTRLESKLTLEAGMGCAGGVAIGQPELASTAYRRPNAKTITSEFEDPESDAGSSANTRGRGSGRGGTGRGGPNRGRGGNRGRGANHRRRDQHAKKMVKAGVLPS